MIFPSNNSDSICEFADWVHCWCCSVKLAGAGFPCLIIENVNRRNPIILSLPAPPVGWRGTEWWVVGGGT